MRATSARRAPQRHILDRTLGESTPLAPGACPHCFRVISLTPTGRRRTHNDDSNGRPCTGSRILVGEYPVTLTVLPPVKVALNGRAHCPGCSRELPLNSDGQIRRHRIRHQDPLAPYCMGGAS